FALGRRVSSARPPCHVSEWWLVGPSVIEPVQLTPHAEAVVTVRHRSQQHRVKQPVVEINALEPLPLLVVHPASKATLYSSSAHCQLDSPGVLDGCAPTTAH